MPSTSVDNIAQDLVLAWRGGETVFPEHPQEVGSRYFLRTPNNDSQTEKIVFIGINPSTATCLGSLTQGGDPTTAMITRFFPVDSEGKPVQFQSMTLINLIPLIGQPHDLPLWSDEEGKEKIKRTLEVTRHIFSVCLAEADRIHLMWGNPKDRRFPWKKEILASIQELIEDTKKPEAKVQAYASKAGYPMHPGFGGLSHWSRTELSIVDR